MARTHRRIKTGRLAARALDNTFTGTTHIIALIGFDNGYQFQGKQRLGGEYGFEFASLDGPNGFPGNTGAVIR